MEGGSGDIRDGSDISSEGSPLEFMATEGARFAQLHASPTGTKETIEAAIPRPRNRLKELITSVAASPSERALAEALLDRHLASLKEDFEPLLQGREIEAPYDRVEGIVALFYGTLTDSYIGIDSHKPSKFWSVHPFLLDHLQHSLDQAPVTNECHGRMVVRVISSTSAQLKAEQNRRRGALRRYILWHKGRAKLLRADPKAVEEIQESYRPTVWSTDIGLWPRTCALLFQPQISASAPMKLQLYRRYDKEHFEEVTNYVQDVLNISKEIFLDGRGKIAERALSDSDQEDLRWSLEAIFEPRLADVWDRFVNSDVRLEHKERKLVTEVVERERQGLDIPVERFKIFDAAMGVGTETVMLTSAGYKVKSNEIDWTLISHARAYAEQHEVPLNFERYDWRHLASKVEAGDHHVALCLGNSLTCLLDHEEMVRAVKGIAAMIRPGGLLVIDERNYRNILERESEMLGADFLFAGSVMYCGEIKAKPVEIFGPRNTAILGYYLDGEEVGRFTVYCFDDGEFEEILSEAGLEVEAVYWDLEAEKKQDSEFVTYIARQPGLETRVGGSDSRPGKRGRG
jgi:glycine/sarcosine N-methyltransferase